MRYVRKIGILFILFFLLSMQLLWANSGETHEYEESGVII
jgi:hypothetical protein